MMGIGSQARESWKQAPSPYLYYKEGTRNERCGIVLPAAMVSYRVRNLPNPDHVSNFPEFFFCVYNE